MLSVGIHLGASGNMPYGCLWVFFLICFVSFVVVVFRFHSSLLQ